MGLFDRKPKPDDGQTRVDLAEGNWVIFNKEMLHGTVKAVGDQTRKYLKSPAGAPTLTLGEGEVKAILKGDLEVDLAEIDWTAVTDIILLHQAVDWSFGEVSADVLDRLPERIHKEMADMVDQLWGGADSGPLPVTVVGN